MAQAPEALSWQVVVFSPSAMVVQVFVPPSEVVQGGDDGSCGKAILKMFDSFFSAAVCFSPSLRMGFYSIGVL